MPIFPELRETVSNFFSGFSDATPTPLSLKGIDFTFDAVSIGEMYRRDGFDRIANILGGGSGPTYSGETVNRNNTIGLSVAWAATRLISECTALLPWEIYQKTSPGVLTKRDDLPIYEVLHYGNDERSSMDMRSTWMNHLLGDGNCFGQIERRSGTGVALDIHPLIPSQVLPGYEKATKANFPRIQYEVSQPGNSNKIFYVSPGEPHDIFHVRGMSYDGLLGYSPTKILHQTIGNALAAHKNAGSFFAHGSRLPYLLEIDKKFGNQEEFDAFRTDWEAIYSQAHRAAILQKGQTYKPIGVSAKDAQSQEFLQWMVYEICRVYGISPVMIGDLTKAAYNSTEVLAQQFVRFTLHPWLVRFEMAFRRCILTPAERRQKIIAKHNLNAILRGDFLQRMQGYTAMIQSGIASINEVREREDMPPVENGDGHNQQMQMQPASNGGLPQTPAQIALLDDTEED